MKIQDYNSVLPDTIEELGVGIKTANLIVGDIYGRLGLTTFQDPKKTEDELRKILDPKESTSFCHRLVLFGRDTCKSQLPKCDECQLRELCVFVKKK